ETDVLGATRILRISWDEAWHLMEHAVERGRAAKAQRIVQQMGVDEKAAAKGHKYITLVTDLEAGAVEYVGDDRKKEPLDAFFAGLSAEQLQGIEAIATDMWEPFLLAIHARVPDAGEKVVFDRFHIMQHVGKAVDTVRKQEHRQLRAD